MVWDGHGLKRDRLGVLEERVRSPHIFQPIHFQQSVFGSHVFRQSQSMVFPRLCEKYVGSVCLKSKLRYV